MDDFDLFEEIEMKKSKQSKDFEKEINKKKLSKLELDELFLL